ncbi:DUF6194 family protein [Glaciihabitans sp. UYNi722]|uniref:DUF6194 family protein n=1 Tax=Glaciihabitans sp. UYNi722 TaxID=3156344 RepID=UPI00339580B7
MTTADIVKMVSDWEQVLVVTPGPGDGSPEVAWGDTFFYYTPDGEMPTSTQPFATIVTKNYPDDDQSELDRVITHPVYGGMGWLAVLNPGAQTLSVTRELLREAYELDRNRSERRHDRAQE